MRPSAVCRHGVRRPVGRGAAARGRLWVSLLAAMALTVGAVRTAQAATVHIGVLAFRPKTEVQRHWQPLAGYLDRAVHGYHFELKAMGYRELERAIAERRVDFVLTNPVHYVRMTYRNGLSSPLATLVPMTHGQPVSDFGGVIFTRADQPDITRLADLRGKRIDAVFDGSLGGYDAQALELLRAGIRVPQDVRLTTTGMPHDAVVQAVMAGKAAVGFVRTGVLEEMAREGKLDLRNIRVINPQHPPDFPFLLSTRLYPEWPFAAMTHVNGDLARRVAAALLSLPHGGKVADAIGIAGFTIPLSYDSVRDLLRELRRPPFEAAPQFTVRDVVHQYRSQLLISALLGGVILLLLLWLLLLIRALGDERRRIARQAEERHHLLAALGEGVYGIDHDGLCTFMNPAGLAMLGYEADEVNGADQHRLFHFQRPDGSDYPLAECPIYLTLQDGLPRQGEEWFLSRSGGGFPVALTITPMDGMDGRKGAVVVFHDISERRRLETELRTQATTDVLTGLPNRRHFLDELERELARIRRRPERSAGVLMIDLDNFKRVNDTYGHAVGDTVLRSFAMLLQGALRGGDLAGRLGGEEFGVLLPDCTLESARRLATRLCHQTAAAVEGVDGIPHYTVSIGVTQMGADDLSVDTALIRADKALYVAKNHGRNQVASEPFSP